MQLVAASQEKEDLIQLLVLSTQELKLHVPSNTTITLQTGNSTSRNGSMSIHMLVEKCNLRLGSVIQR